MIALIISRNWDQFYASSPYLNLLRSEHPAFQKFAVLPHELESEEIRTQINACEAVVCDDVNGHALGFYKNGPKFLVGGDEHSFTREAADNVEKLYSYFDYVLAGTPNATVNPRHFHISKEAKLKQLYFPHSVADAGPDPLAWKDRYRKAVLTGDIHPEVYSFRHKCSQLTQNSPIERLIHGKFVHEDYFRYISTYRYGITCNSPGWLNYTVAKYFEIPWMGTCLIAPPIPEWEQELLGFKSIENVVFVSDPEQVPKVIQTLEANDAGKAYGEAGRELILKYHTVSKRLDYIKALIDDINFYGSTMTTEHSYHVFAEVKERHDRR